MATSTHTDAATRICDFTAFTEVPWNFLMRRCCLIHLKNNSTRRRALHSSQMVVGGGPNRLVGKNQRLLCVGVFEANAAQVARAMLVTVETRQGHRLIADDSLRPVARWRIGPTRIGVRFGAGDEERARLAQSEQPLEIEVGPIHHANRRRLRNQQVEHVDIVRLAVGNMDETWSIATQIQQRAHLHGSFGAAKRRPGKQRFAKKRLIFMQLCEQWVQLTGQQCCKRSL